MKTLSSFSLGVAAMLWVAVGSGADPDYGKREDAWRKSYPRAQSEKNKAQIRANYERFNKHDLSFIDEQYTDDTRNHGKIIGKARLKKIVEDIFYTFPDYHHEILEILSDGPTVATRIAVSGCWKNKGKLAYAFGGKEPNGECFNVQQMHFYQFNDAGKLIGHRASRDDVAMMQQLGIFEWKNFSNEPFPDATVKR